MTPLPISLAAAPSTSGAAAQSLLPADTASGDSNPLGMAFISQLSKLLQSTALMAQLPAADASGAQPGSAPTASTGPDTTSSDAGSQPQLVLPPLPIVAPPAKQPDARAVQTRGLGNNKPKAESASPKNHSDAALGPPAVPTMATVPTPEPVVLPPVMATATREGTAQHEPVRAQHSEQSVISSADQSVSSVQKLDWQNAGMVDPDRQQTADAPTQFAPAQPSAEAAATVIQAAPPQPTAPSVRSVETTATPAPSPAPHPTSPAAQLTPALMQMGHAPDGAQRLTVRLDPPELGRVQIKIDRPSDASARVEITVEKQETLTLLLRDQPQLQRTLDQAGVPMDGRTVTFHVAAPVPAVRTEAGTIPVPGTSAGGLTGDGSHSATRQNGQPARQQHDTTDDDGAGFAPIAARGWLRAGLDITA